MKVGVIGLGKMGLLHGGISNSLEQTELVAAADKDKILPGFMRKLNSSLTIYDDYVKMLDEAGLNAAIITTPVHLHVPIAEDCANRGIHFFCEKPMSLNGESAVKLYNIVKENNVVSMIGYMMRYLDTFKEGKRVLDSGALGKLITFNGSIYVGQLFREGKGWRYDKEKSGGGVLMNQGSHLVDMILWYFGRAVKASGSLTSHYAQGVEDFAHGTLEFNSGLKGWLDISWSKKHHRLVDTLISVQGENGTLEVTDDELKVYLDESSSGFDSGWTVKNKTELYKGVQFDIGGPEYSAELIDFYEAISKGEKVESDVASGLRVQRVIDAMYVSSKQSSAAVEVVIDE